MSAKYQRLKFPIHEVKEDLLKAFPELQRYEVFAQYSGKDRDKWIKYIIYLYDINSELIREYELLSDRKLKAVELAGLNPNDNLVQKVMSFDFKIESEDKEGNKTHEYDPAVLKVYGMIHVYLTRVQHNYDYIELCTVEQELEENMRRRLEKIEAGDDISKELLAFERKNKLRKYGDEMRESREALLNKIYKDNVDAEAYRYIERPATPENIARG